MRVTIFGATGLLGKALMREWKEDEVTGFGSADGDIRDAEQVLHLVQRTRPDWIVLAAAYTDVDGCEANRDLAFNVNCRAAVNVAQAAKQYGARLLFLSTDYVFDGTKTTPYATDDLRSPRSVYGQSKAEAEVQLGQILPQCCIVRTSWLFGTGGKCFPDTILKLAATRQQLEVVGSCLCGHNSSKTVGEVRPGVNSTTGGCRARCCPVADRPRKVEMALGDSDASRKFNGSGGKRWG